MFEELTLDHFSLKEDLLKECRKNIYKSDMPGYIIIRNFINDKNVEYLRNIWQRAAHSTQGFFEQFPGKDDIYLGCPNYYNIYKGELKQDVYYNFLWNKPYEELSYNICIYLQLLKNAISGRNMTDFLLPTLPSPILPEATNFRVILTKNGNNIVKPHRDWYDLENYKMYDTSRLQATLILSKNTVDYEGRGFIFTTNFGRKIAFDVDVEVNPGDLILWRHSNEHAIENVTTQSGQLGFLRILLMSEYAHPIKISRNKPGAIYKFTPNAVKKMIPSPIKKVLKKVLG